jgi:hypothetical protein
MKRSNALGTPKLSATAIFLRMLNSILRTRVEFSASVRNASANVVSKYAHLRCKKCWLRCRCDQLILNIDVLVTSFQLFLARSRNPT